MRKVAALLALVWSLGVPMYLLKAPLYSSVVTSVATSASGARQTPHAEVSRSTLLEVNGPRVLLPFAIPALLCLLALAAPAQVGRAAAAAAGVLVGLFSLLAAWTIGLYFLPAALSLLVGAIPPVRARARPA